jgi:hypothetical protein
MFKLILLLLPCLLLAEYWVVQGDNIYKAKRIIKGGECVTIPKGSILDSPLYSGNKIGTVVICGSYQVIEVLK